MPLEVVRRVVDGGEQAHVRFPQHAARRHVRLGERNARLLPDLLRCLRGERHMRVEIAQELEMHPGVHGVADGARHHRRELLEAVAPRRLAARDVFLLDAVRAHEAPFIVIRREPRLREVPIAHVLRDLARAHMRMEIENRHLRRVLMVELLRCLIFQEEIFVHEAFHKKQPPSFVACSLFLYSPRAGKVLPRGPA